LKRDSLLGDLREERLERLSLHSPKRDSFFVSKESLSSLSRETLLRVLRDSLWRQRERRLQERLSLGRLERRETLSSLQRERRLQERLSLGRLDSLLGDLREERVSLERRERVSLETKRESLLRECVYLTHTPESV